MMTLYANTHCSVVAGGAVTQTGQFRDLIAPTSTLSGGTDDTYAKTRWGIYPHSAHTATATHTVAQVTPAYDVEEDKVYTTELVALSAAEIKSALKDQAAARRWEVETGGIIRNGLSIATDQISQTKIGGALQLVQADDQIEIRWKGPAGWVGMDATTVTYVAEQIGLHVQAAFAREEAICLAIDADTPVNILTGAIDGVGAWPT